MSRRTVVAALLVILAVLAAGCGRAGDGETTDRTITTTVTTDQGGGGTELGEVHGSVPAAQGQRPAELATGAGTSDIGAFMNDVMQNIDEYWTRTLTAAGLPEARVGFATVPAGRTADTACGTPADDRQAFYCPADDTIYVGERFAQELLDGVAMGLPGQQAGLGRAAGDFAVAYVLAHEYAHAVQQELGVYDARPSGEAKPFELQADCLAGTWANSVYDQGRLEPGDLEEGLQTALAVGDFELGTAQHHGTPEERANALLRGFRSGDPAVCAQFLEF